jgi:hypothetical protein
MMGGPVDGQDAFPRSAVLRAELVRDAGRYAATLELPDGSRADLAAATESDVRADVLAAARRFLHQQGHRFGRLTVADPDRLWELVLPADDAQEPVVLGEAARTGAAAAEPATGPRNGLPAGPPQAGRDSPPLVADELDRGALYSERSARACTDGLRREQASRPRRPEQARMSEFPADATLAATVARTSWGQYGATLTLPDGQQHVFAGAELDGVRARVLKDARRYLATQVGRPGRLEVTDPEGTWVLGIPPDGGQLVAIASAPASATAPPVVDESRGAERVSAARARSVLLPSRPAIPTRRRRPRGHAHSHHGHRSLGERRLPLLALLAAAILAVVLVQALDHRGSTATAAKHTRSVGQNAFVRAGNQPATFSKPGPAPKPASTPRPVRHKPTTRAAVHHEAAATKTRRAAPGAGQHHPRVVEHPSTTVSSSAPAVTSTPAAPVVTRTPPAQAPASSEPSHTARAAPLPTPSGPPPL